MSAGTTLLAPENQPHRLVKAAFTDLHKNGLQLQDMAPLFTLGSTAIGISLVKNFDLHGCTFASIIIPALKTPS